MDDGCPAESRPWSLLLKNTSLPIYGSGCSHQNSVSSLRLLISGSTKVDHLSSLKNKSERQDTILAALQTPALQYLMSLLCAQMSSGTQDALLAPFLFSSLKCHRNMSPITGDALFKVCIFSNMPDFLICSVCFPGWQMAASDQNPNHTIPWLCFLPKAHNGLLTTSIFSYITSYIVFRWSPKWLWLHQKPISPKLWFFGTHDLNTPLSVFWAIWSPWTYISALPFKSSR
jgi:hypothetical protein